MSLALDYPRMSRQAHTPEREFGAPPLPRRRHFQRGLDAPQC